MKKELRFHEKGISILIAMEEKGVDTTIDVSMEEILKKVTFDGATATIAFDNFSVFVTKKKEDAVLPSNFTIESKAKQYSKEVLEKGITFIRRDSENYKVKIFIPKETLFSDEEIAEFKKQRKQKQQKAKAAAKDKPRQKALARLLKSGKNLGLYSKEKTQYSRSNVDKPYQGGKCTPK